MQTDLKRKPAARGRASGRSAPALAAPPKAPPRSPKARGGLKPVQAKEPRLRPAHTSARAFKAIAGSALDQIAANAQVLLRARRPEALHQLRVGLRRLRGAMSLFSPMLDDGDYRFVKAELRWLTKQLNDARNLDVFIQDAFRPAAKAHRDWVGMAALGKALLTAQTRAYDLAQAVVGSQRFDAALQTTAHWVETGAWSASADPRQAALRARPIGELAPELLDKSRRRVIKRGRGLSGLSEQRRHDLRLDVKQLRYATAFFGALFDDRKPKAHKRFAAAMQALQSALGEQTDIATAAELTADLAAADEQSILWSGHPKPVSAYAAGRVAAHRALTGDAAMSAAAEGFKRFRRAKAFW